MNDLNLKIIKDYVDKKVAGALTGKSAYEIAVEQGYDGTEEEWLSEMKDYSKLNNKPLINGVELSDNKTSSDLGLSEALNSSETISVESGGLLNIQKKSIDFRFFTDGIRDVLLYTNSIFSHATENGYLNGLQKNMIVYINFNEVREDDRRNLPTNAFDGYFITISCKDSQWMQLAIDTYYPNKNYIRFGQPMGGSAFPSYNQWQEIGSGSQIASGIVNQNGTISFYDADGNLLFTTTGASVIGFSPIATVTQTASGATVSITDKNGTTTANITNGAPGQDYVLTAQDKTDIANIVLGELPTTEGVLYGNTSN